MATNMNEFIDYMELVNVPFIGNIFTWSNRFLLSESLIDSWKIIGHIMGDKDISNHSPIWIKANEMD